jgi:hypothetical protein
VEIIASLVNNSKKRSVLALTKESAYEVGKKLPPREEKLQSQRHSATAASDVPAGHNGKRFSRLVAHPSTESIHPGKDGNWSLEAETPMKARNHAGASIEIKR